MLKPAAGKGNKEKRTRTCRVVISFTIMVHQHATLADTQELERYLLPARVSAVACGRLVINNNKATSRTSGKSSFILSLELFWFWLVELYYVSPTTRPAVFSFLMAVHLSHFLSRGVGKGNGERKEKDSRAEGWRSFFLKTTARPQAVYFGCEGKEKEIFSPSLRFAWPTATGTRKHTKGKDGRIALTLDSLFLFSLCFLSGCPGLRSS